MFNALIIYLSWFSINVNVLTLFIDVNHKIQNTTKQKQSHLKVTFTLIYLADAFIQSDFQERGLQKCIGQWS